ncbi:hypothetical protein T492DRAFT_1007779, partial [Pavlovales sp. CCMP2436]
MCAVCSICSRGFDLNQSGNGPHGGRSKTCVTAVAYFSKASSKSNDYAKNSERDGVRVMFLCKV